MFSGTGYRPGNGLRAVTFNMYRLRRAQPSTDISDDFIGIFITWIVIGQHHMISMVLRNFTHQWPLATIAISTTAKHNP